MHRGGINGRRYCRWGRNLFHLFSSSYKSPVLPHLKVSVTVMTVDMGIILISKLLVLGASRSAGVTQEGV